MNYLLDTNVISELRKRKPHGAVLAWLESLRDQDIQIPAVAIAELQDVGPWVRASSVTFRFFCLMEQRKWGLRGCRGDRPCEARDQRVTTDCKMKPPAERRWIMRSQIHE